MKQSGIGAESEGDPWRTPLEQCKVIWDTIWIWGTTRTMIEIVPQSRRVRRWELGVQTVFPISFAALSPICSVSYMIYFFHKSCLGTNMYQFAIRSHEHSSRPPLLASGMLHQQDEWLPKGWNGAADCLILFETCATIGDQHGWHGWNWLGLGDIQYHFIYAL